MMLQSTSVLLWGVFVMFIAPCRSLELHAPVQLELSSQIGTDCSLVAYNTLTACKAEMKRLTEKLTFHTATYTAKDVSTIRTCSISAFVLALVVVGICWRCSSVKAAKKHAEHLEQLQQQAKQQVQQLHQRHVQELEDARKSLKRARAETRMITKHHTGKFLLPDPAPYQKKHSVLMYAAKHYGFEDGDNMVANLLHILYKLIKLQVLYQYIFEVLQMLPTPSIEADEDDLILQRDDGPSPSRATEDAMWGKIFKLDEDLDTAILKFEDTIAEPSILNSLEPKWNQAATDRINEVINKDTY